jgi:glutaredoxin
LCRRAAEASAPQAIELAPEASGSRLPLVVASALLAVATAVAVFLWMGGSLQDAQPAAAAVVIPPVDPATRELRAKAAAAAQFEAQLRTKTVAVEPAAEPTAPSEQALPAPSLDPLSAQDEAERAARAAEDERRHQEVMAAIAARDRARATSSVEITMYSTSWCPACTAARDHMRAQGIAFTERNVEEDPAAKAQQLQLNPRGGVPTIDVDGKEVLVGFSAGKLKAAIDRSIAKRTGS